MNRWKLREVITMIKWIVMGIGMIFIFIDFIQVYLERKQRKMEAKEKINRKLRNNEV